MITIDTIDEANKMISEFKIKFKDEFGVTPFVYFTFSTKKVKRATLKQVEDFFNSIISENFGEAYPNGIRQKTRKRELLVYRQIAQFLCQKMGYGVVHLKHYFQWDHATSLHSKKVITNFIETNDKEFATLYQPLIVLFNETFRDDNDVPDIRGSENNT
jgi:hypothetical protein